MVNEKVLRFLSTLKTDFDFYSTNYVEKYFVKIQDIDKLGNNMLVKYLRSVIYINNLYYKSIFRKNLIKDNDYVLISTTNEELINILDNIADDKLYVLKPLYSITNSKYNMVNMTIPNKVDSFNFVDDSENNINVNGIINQSYENLFNYIDKYNLNYTITYRRIGNSSYNIDVIHKIMNIMFLNSVYIKGNNTVGYDFIINLTSVK